MVRSDAKRRVSNHGPQRVATIKLARLLQRDGVLAVVKAWPGDVGGYGEGTATAILDDGCARRPARAQVGTKKRPPGRTKKQIKAELAGSRVTSGGWKLGGGKYAALPRRTALDDGVGEDQKLSRTGDEGNLVFLPGGAQAVVEGDKLGVPPKR